ncbi:alpha/beta hydrolase, partial [bacterium]|nr:alpha/beta hydrolase [bacterium]
MIAVSNHVSLQVIELMPADDQNRPAVLFIPGWISLISGWKKVLNEMTKDHRVYYIETREKISSRIQGKVEYSVEAIGQDIVTLTSQLGLADGKYILFGSSLGATSILE